MLGVAGFGSAIVAPIIIAGVLFLVVIISVIITVARAKNSASVDMDVLQENIAEAQQSNEGVAPSQTTYTCQYCGAILSSTDNKCPSCGAPNKRNN